MIMITHLRTYIVTMIDTASAEITFFSFIFTAENDFENAAAQLTFSPTTSEMCIVIAIVNDSILENDEEFTVQLQTADEAVILDPQSSVVIISNDDGMKLALFPGLHIA